MLPNPPLDVTVIIPVWNKRGTIIRCLHSVLAQTSMPRTIIVVDDGSDDGSLEAAQTAALEWSRIEVVRLERNCGPGAARNAGAKKTATEWLAFLDADDTWDPAFLESVCRAIAEVGGDFGASGRRLIRQDDAATETGGETFLVGGLPTGGVNLSADFWKVARRFMPVNSSSAVVRRQLFLAVGGFPEDVRRMEDFTLWARLWLHGTFVYVDRALSTYHKDRFGLSGQPLRYRDTYLHLLALTGVLLKSLAIRKPGSGWLLAFYVRSIVGKHASYFRRNLMRLVVRSPVSRQRIAS